MVVTMLRMNVVEMIPDKIVDMSRMGNSLVAATVAVHVVGIVRSALVSRRTRGWVLGRAGDLVIHYRSVGGVMQVAVV